MMHTLKTKLQKYQSFIDKAFQLIQQGLDDQIFEGCTIVTKVWFKTLKFKKNLIFLIYFMRILGRYEFLLEIFITIDFLTQFYYFLKRFLQQIYVNLYIFLKI